MKRQEISNTGRHALAIAVAAVLSAACAGSAFAQENQTTLKEVTISAGKEKPVQDRTELGKLTEHTPISGAVLERDEVERLQPVNPLMELGRRVPGISMIRNMRIPDGGKLYTEGRIDGLRTSGGNTSVLDELHSADIERIEVITGPASALYGSGAFGGTISMFTRQPPREFGARLSQELGSFGFRRTQGNAGASTADGRFGFIVTGSTLDTEGWRLSPAPGSRDAAAEHKDGLSLRVLLRPFESTKVTLGRSEVKYDFRWAGPLRLTRFNQDWRQTEAGTYGQYDDTYKTTSARLQQAIGARGEFTLAFARVTDDQLNFGNGGSGGANNVICDDASAIAAPLAVGTTVKCRAVNNNSAAVTNTIKPTITATKTTQAMYRHDFDLAKTTAYVGAEWVDVSTDSSTVANRFNALQAQSGAWVAGAQTATGQGSFSRQRETTPFVHVEFSPLERLRFHVGERFGKIDFDVNDRTVANRDVTMTRRGNVLRAGATYDLGRSHVVWANWGETFNPQSTASLLDSATKGTAGNVIGAVLAPERGVTREIGLRGRIDDWAIRYDATLFHGETKGFIVPRTCTVAEQTALNLGAACTVNENSGALVTKGLESVFGWAANRWLDIGATYTYSEAYFSKFVSTTFDFTGKSYQAMPRHKLNLRVGVKPAPGWLIELEGDHISEYYVDNTNLQGSYKRPNLLALRASYRSKGWSFWLHALNLTNRHYATRVQLSTVAGTANVLSAQAGQGNPGSYTPLNVRVGVAYNF